MSLRNCTILFKCGYVNRCQLPILYNTLYCALYFKLIQRYSKVQAIYWRDLMRKVISKQLEIQLNATRNYFENKAQFKDIVS